MRDYIHVEDLAAGHIAALQALTTLDANKNGVTELGELAKTPAANIIKLPNVSASVPQVGRSCVV